MEENKNTDMKKLNENMNTNENTESSVAELNTPLVYEEYESTEIAEKPKKRFKKRYLAIAAAAVVGGVLVVNNINASRNAVTYVTTSETALGTIENILSISGTVQSAESKTYFSDVTAPVSEISVKVGDKVSEGDVLYAYDEEAIDLAMQTAELSIKQAKGNYSSYYSGTSAADRKYAEGMTADQINDRLDAITAEIDNLNNLITEKTSRMNQTLTDLQKVQADINQNGISDSSEEYFENGNNGYIYRNESDTKENEEYTNPTASDRQMSLAVQQSILDVQYALQNDEEIQGWKNQITALQEEQSHLSSAKASYLNAGTVSAAKAQMDSTLVSQEDTISKLEAAKEGVKADFNGVVTNINVVEGATVSSGTQVITLANLDDVEVTLQVSKSDLSKIAIGQQVDITINNKAYSGEITKISGNATKNSNGVAVVDTTIKVTNPDEDIILGVEASNKIHAQKAENTLVVPYEYVQTDSEGDFVYVVEDGIIVRKNVTVGIASSTEAQITEGLSEGELIVTADYDNLFEGMQVVIAE